MTVLAPDPLASRDAVEPELLIREARRRQRRRRLTVIAVAAAVLASYFVTRSAAPAPPSQSLLARALHFPSLGPDGRCPVSSGQTVNNALFGGSALGNGPVRVLLANTHGRIALGARAPSGWFGLQTIWFAMPNYNGPFVVRGKRLGRPARSRSNPEGPGTTPARFPAPVRWSSRPGRRSTPSTRTGDQGTDDAVTGRLSRP